MHPSTEPLATGIEVSKHRSINVLQQSAAVQKLWLHMSQHWLVEARIMPSQVLL